MKIRRQDLRGDPGNVSYGMLSERVDEPQSISCMMYLQSPFPVRDAAKDAWTKADLGPDPALVL